MFPAVEEEKKAAGFTLVELLIAIALIAVLTSGGGALLIDQHNNSHDVSTKSELKDLAVAIDAALLPDTATISGGAGRAEPLIIDGFEIAQRGANIHIDPATKAYCLSKQSKSGRIWSIDSARGSLYESGTWCQSATSPPPAGENTQGMTVSLSGNLLEPDQAEPELSGFVEYPDVDLRPVAVDAGSAPTAGLEATIQPGAASAPATTVQPDDGACGNLEVVPGKIYHVEAFLESASTNSRPATVLLQYYDANNNIVGTSRGQWKQPGSKGITQAESVAPEGAVKATCRPVYVENPNPDDYYVFGQFGVWEGEGGQWAPPGTPIMEKGKPSK